MRARGSGRALLAGVLLVGGTACTVEHENGHESRRGAADVLTAVVEPSGTPSGASRPAPPTAAPPQGCPHDGSVAGDVDGDGHQDRVVHVWLESQLVVRVCFADGGRQQVPGAGMGEVLDAQDLDGDGHDEVLYGGTAVTWAGNHVARVVDGRLVVVRVGKQPLDLRSGFGPTDGSVFTWGSCGNGDLRQVYIERDDDGWRARTITWHLDRARATAVARLVEPWLAGPPRQGDVSDVEPLLGECPQPR